MFSRNKSGPTFFVALFLLGAAIVLPAQTAPVAATQVASPVAQEGQLDPTFGVGGKADGIPYDATGGAEALALRSDGKIVAAGWSLVGARTAFAVARYGANGAIDTTFTANGGITTPIGTQEAAIYALALQSDNKVVVAGNAGGKLALARYRTDGTLDPAFGAGGVVRTTRSISDTRPAAIALDGNGKIVVPAGGGNAFVVLRFNTDGSPDNSFGNGGAVSTDITSGPDQAAAVRLDADGKILVVGSTGSDFAIARYSSNGTLDTSFGGAPLGTKPGVAVVDMASPSGNNTDAARSLAVQSDGKIVVGGVAGYEDGLIRLTTNGQLDPTFSGDGKVSFFSPIASPDDVVLQSDGKIVFLGYQSLYRLNTDGTLDQTFGENGDLRTQIAAFGLAIDANDRLVLVGRDLGPNFGTAYFAVERRNSDGTLDKTFGTDGVVIRNFVQNHVARFNGIALQPDGKILLSGQGRRYDWSVSRFKPDGTIDTEFGAAGVVEHEVDIDHIANSTAHVVGVALLPNGKIAAGGYTYHDQFENWPAYDTMSVCRYTAGGARDGTFNGTGCATATHPGLAHALAVQADGKLIVGGNDSINSEHILLARFNSDGSADASFGNAGAVALEIPGNNEQLYALKMQPDGKIVGAGLVAGAHGYDFLLVRLNADGSPDTSFGTNGIVINDIGVGDSDGAYALGLDSDGRIVAGGYVLGHEHYFSAIARFNPDGTLDPSFAAQGKITITHLGNEEVLALAIHPHGKIVTAGRFENNGVQDFLTQRLLLNGIYDNSFGDFGVITDVGGADDRAQAVAIQADGKVVAAGIGGIVRYQAAACQPGYYDVINGTEYFYAAVYDLTCRGAISGYADHTFRPFNNNTRAQMVKIIVAANGWQLLNPATPTFNDVATTDTFYRYIETAAARGVVGGYADRTFRPGTDVTRGQLAKIVVKAAGWQLLNPATPTFVDVPRNNPFYKEIETAAAKDVISGYDTSNGREFFWGTFAIRAQIAKIVDLALQAPASVKK